jgi:twitching motility protein PilT
MAKEIDDILSAAVYRQASDIHFTVGRPPMIRAMGEMKPLENIPVLETETCKQLIYSILSVEQRRKFEEDHELDCSYIIPSVCRFRVNILLQKGHVEAVLRLIPSKIPTAQEIGLSLSVMQLTTLPRGLILVTGPTGSGKTTTLASMIDAINISRHDHIVTVEDPIEFSYENKNCVIRQREVGTDTRSFAEALKHVLRQDPDVILVGELRDLETIQMAITAAETGHLVFATLHTQDAPQTVDRIIDVFPSHQQEQVRVQLAGSLQGVISQQLVPDINKKRRVAVREIMTATPAICNLIREGKTHQIYSAIETGAKFGMNTMDSALLELFRQKIISPDTALSMSHNQETMRIKLGISTSASAPVGPGNRIRPGGP